MQGLHEPREEAPGVAQILLNGRDQFRPKLSQQSQLVHPVHHDGLVRANAELTQVGDAPDFALDRVELEGEPERAGEIGDEDPNPVIRMERIFLEREARMWNSPGH
ncbi:hypothetical protein CR513_20290, partial [Mucuna pruriens]